MFSLKYNLDLFTHLHFEFNSAIKFLIELFHRTWILSVQFSSWISIWIVLRHLNFNFNYFTPLKFWVFNFAI